MLFSIKSIVVLVLVVGIAIFLKSDGNVPLMFLNYPEKGKSLSIT